MNERIIIIPYQNCFEIIWDFQKILDGSMLFSSSVCFFFQCLLLEFCCSFAQNQIMPILWQSLQINSHRFLLCFLSQKHNNTWEIWRTLWGLVGAGSGSCKRTAQRFRLKDRWNLCSRADRWSNSCAKITGPFFTFLLWTINCFPYKCFACTMNWPHHL